MREYWDKEKGCFLLSEPVTHRMRRGKLVEIPEEWRGRITHKQTIRKRASKRLQGASFRNKHFR